GRVGGGGRAPQRGDAADGARVVAPVCRRRWAGRVGQPVVAARLLSASDVAAGGGGDRGDAAGASGVGPGSDPLAVGPRPGGAGAGPLECVSGAEAPRTGRGEQAQAASGGLPAVGARPVDGAVADGCDG